MTYSSSILKLLLRGLGRPALLGLLISCGPDRPGPSGSSAPNEVPGAQDSLPAQDTLPPTDSLLPPDTLLFPPDSSSPGDSLPPDSVNIPTDSLGPDSLPPIDTVPERVPVYTGIPYGPFRLWKDSVTLRWGPDPFSTSFNSVDAREIIGRIKAARAMNHRVFLGMSTGHSRYMTGEKFDMAKWKERINTFDRPEIKAAIAKGVADGTIIGNAVLDEPNTKKWGSIINKATIDEMCGYVKSLFPTLPNGIVAVHWWRPTERYKVCDFVVDQWDWWQGPKGAGPGSYTGNITAWREEALRQAKKDGVSIVFSMNVLNGGIHSWVTKTCPAATTGGKGPSGIACRMSPAQVRSWGLELGLAGCAMLMWRHDAEFMETEANLRAFKEVAERLSEGPPSNCRRKD